MQNKKVPKFSKEEIEAAQAEQEIPRFSQEEIESAQAEIPKFSPEEIATVSGDDYSFSDQAEAAGRGALRGLTLGQSDKALDAISAGIISAQQGIESGTGLSFDDFKKEYEKQRALTEGVESKYPKTTLGTELGTGLGQLGLGAAKYGAKKLGALGAAELLGEGSNVLGKYDLGQRVAGGAGQAIEALAPSEKLKKIGGITGGVSRVLQAGAKGAASGAAMGGVQALGGELGGGSQGPGVLDSAEFGGILGAGLQAVPELWGGTKALARGAMYVFTGVNPKIQRDYLQRFEELKTPTSLDDIKSGVDGIVAKLKTDVENGNISTEQANQALLMAQEEADKLKAALTEGKQQMLFDTAKEIKNKKEIIEKKVEDAYRPIKLAKPPTDLVDDVVQAADELNQRIKDGSAEAYDILDKSGVNVNISKVGGLLQEAKKDLAIMGSTLISEESEAAFESLSKLQRKFSTLPDEIPATEAKKLVQDLDREIKWQGDKFGYKTRASNAILDARRSIDASLKGNEEYEKIMRGVYEDRKLLTEAEDFFKKERALQSLNTIGGESSKYRREALYKLGQATGRDFQTDVDKYINTRAIRADADAYKEKIRQSLPEYSELRLLENKLNFIKEPQNKSFFVEDVIPNQPATKQAIKAKNNLAQQQAALDEARQVYKQFQTITPNTSKDFLNGVLSGKAERNKNKLADLSKLADQDFVRQIEDLKLLSQFDKRNQNGSTNTNLWAIVGTGALASGTYAAKVLLDDEEEFDPRIFGAAAALGGTMGKVLDIYGPRIAKEILNGVGTIQGIPTVKKIENLNISPESKQILKNDLIRLWQMQEKPEKIPVDEALKPMSRFDIRNSENLSASTKAKALDELNRTGSVDSGLIAEMSVGNETAPKEERRRNIIGDIGRLGPEIKDLNRRLEAKGYDLSDPQIKRVGNMLDLPYRSEPPLRTSKGESFYKQDQTLDDFKDTISRYSKRVDEDPSLSNEAKKAIKMDVNSALIDRYNEYLKRDAKGFSSSGGLDELRWNSFLKSPVDKYVPNLKWMDLLKTDPDEFLKEYKRRYDKQDMFPEDVA